MTALIETKQKKDKNHKIGEHGAIVMLVRKGNKVYEYCCECKKKVREV